jgi:hypothetical protein
MNLIRPSRFTKNLLKYDIYTNVLINKKRTLLILGKNLIGVPLFYIKNIHPFF